ncbi:MAG: acetyl-CoA carboxylase biotin carboxylase subunit [Hyphomicrobiales bacterium]|nr:acetyl-CoA carboxylase biotin carboxylase subunit [Hyphomicrobiales bacterium]
MLRRVLIANRGEIAVRIIRACEALGIETVAALSQADLGSLPAQLADRTICIGPGAAAQSYLSIPAIITAALGADCDAVHPGYGFLAESPQLAQACLDNGLIFVGPSPLHIRCMGNKLEARAIAKECDVPTLPGSECVRDADEAAVIAARIGYPVMLKAAAGGGGRGMKIVNDSADMPSLFTAAATEARAAFGDDTVYLERYIAQARHIEVQLLGDRHGNIIHLGERDCSLQRRHQKLIEEAPAPGIPETLRARIREAALALGRRMAYENAGTVEFIVDQATASFFFLEMNTRIQVEHPVTEAIAGIDLVEAQLRIASGEPLWLSQADIVLRGHAIECRVNAETPWRGFQPSPGRLTRWNPPTGPNVRLDTHCFAGYEIPVFYDSLLAKLIVYGADRSEALRRMQRALDRFDVAGVDTTLPFLRRAIAHDEFSSGRVNTLLAEAIIVEMTRVSAAGAVDRARAFSQD